MELKKKTDGYWHVGFQTDHGYKWRNTKATTKEDAESVCRQAKISEIENAAKAMTLNGEVLSAVMAGRKITCEQVLTEWVEWRTRLRSAVTAQTQAYLVAAFLRRFDLAKKLINRIDAAPIDDYVNGEAAGGRHSRDGRIAALKSYFDYAAAKGYIVGSPVKLIGGVNHRLLTQAQKERKQRVPFTEEEYRRVVSNTSGFWRYATALSYWAGLRLGDIATLEWASLKGTEIVVHTAKRDVRVALPLSDPLIGGGELALVILEIMETVPRRGKSERFIFPDEAATNQDLMRRSKLSTYYGRILTRLGIEDKTFHCLRHSFCTRLKKAGKTEEEIGRLVGHADVETTKRYIHSCAGTG